MSSANAQGGIDITTLPVQQLSQVQARISQELEHLSTSYQRLRAAQTRFKDCIRSIKDGVEGKKGDTPLLVPLTTSLYVPATLDASKPNTVLVDVGTGFYVEKSTSDAIKFYTGKVDDLTKNLGDIEKVVAGKNDNLRMVEDGETSLHVPFACVYLDHNGRLWRATHTPTAGFAFADRQIVLRQKVLAGQGQEKS